MVGAPMQPAPRLAIDVRHRRRADRDYETLAGVGIDCVEPYRLLLREGLIRFLKALSHAAPANAIVLETA
jgi:hypothetical protein